MGIDKVVALNFCFYQSCSHLAKSKKEQTPFPF